MTTNEVKRWFLSGTNPSAYTMKTDNEVFHTSSKSGYLCSAHPAEKGQFGIMMQVFSAEKWIGKRMKISFFIKTKDAIKCGAWCCIEIKNGDIVQFDNMNNRSIQGTTDWNNYSIVLDVPEVSVSINFGILLVGSGEVWIDRVNFDEVDLSNPSTNITCLTDDLPIEPVNLNFDEL